MKREIKIQDFWKYVSQIHKEVIDEVLDQITEDEYYPCVRDISNYMFDLRAMHLDIIWHFNSVDNKYIKLINKALAKRNIFIASNYIHISIG